MPSALALIVILISIQTFALVAPEFSVKTMSITESQDLPPSGKPPAAISWMTKLVSDDEAGEPLIVTGTVYAPDGKKPLEGVVMYVYQTDASGVYNRTDRSWQRPRLRGWVKTDAGGRYEIHTIKPGSYPGSKNPAHIHATVTLPGGVERWIDEFLFDGDPFLSEMDRAQANEGDFSNVMRIHRGVDGILRCVRNIKLNAK